MIAQVRNAATRLGVFTADDLRAETGLPREAVDTAVAVLSSAGYVVPATTAPRLSRRGGAHCKGCPLVVTCSQDSCPPTDFAPWRSAPLYTYVPPPGSAGDRERRRVEAIAAEPEIDLGTVGG